LSQNKHIISFNKGRLKKRVFSSLQDFISGEQTKETDEGDKSNSVVYGRCVQRPTDERPTETSG
jgi:hypothetical protein